MTVLPIDLPAARAAVDQASKQVERLLRSIADMSVPASRLEWTIGETGAHLVTVTSWFVDYVNGRKKPPVTTLEIPAFNAERIADFTERDGSRLASHLHQAVQEFLTSTRSQSGDAPFPWYDGRTIDVVSGTCLLLGELVVHGFDIAHGVDRTWEIDPDHARLVLAGSLSVLPLYVARDRAHRIQASYEIRIRGGPLAYWRFADGELTVTATRTDPVDCRISADPVDFLLLSYGRIGRLSPILRGNLITWGRRPWLGLKLQTLLLSP